MVSASRFALPDVPAAPGWRTAAKAAADAPEEDTCAAGDAACGAARAPAPAPLSDDDGDEPEQDELFPYDPSENYGNLEGVEMSSERDNGGESLYYTSAAKDPEPPSN